MIKKKIMSLKRFAYTTITKTLAELGLLGRVQAGVSWKPGRDSAEGRVSRTVRAQTWH